MNATAATARPHTPRLSPQAVLALGLAGLSLPFSDSPEGEVECWLRIMRLGGRTGRVLQAIGVGEASVRPAGTRAEREGRRLGDHVIDLVSALAVESCLARQGDVVETEDVLAALLDVYGSLLEEALEAHGTSAQEVRKRLAPMASAAPSSSPPPA